ncbi:hypothetical protein DFH06DRAFT_8204 [Mycena polygramma]|nr:hypothetical protein DFH06DRAFT_8204 [Mycena polygramma]
MGFQSRLRIDGPLPLLKKLTIGSRVNCYRPIKAITVFRNAPLLREVELVLDDGAIVGPSTILLPWTQLTTFTGRLLTVDECLCVPREATFLTDCSFPNCIEDDELHSDAKALYPLIKTLRLEGLQHPRLDLLHYLTLPSLEVLDLGNFSTLREPIMDIAEVFSSFLLRSSCSLRELRLVISGIWSEQLLQWLTAMPTLEILELRFLGFSYSDFFKQMHAAADLLPRLRSLSFLETMTYKIPYDDLFAILLARSAGPNDDMGPTRLESFTWTWTEPRIAAADVQFLDRYKVLDRFKVLVGKGMHIHLGRPNESWV